MVNAGGWGGAPAGANRGQAGCFVGRVLKWATGLLIFVGFVVAMVGAPWQKIMDVFQAGSDRVATIDPGQTETVELEKGEWVLYLEGDNTVEDCGEDSICRAAFDAPDQITVVGPDGDELSMGSTAMVGTYDVGGRKGVVHGAFDVKVEGEHQITVSPDSDIDTVALTKSPDFDPSDFTVAIIGGVIMAVGIVLRIIVGIASRIVGVIGN